MQSPVRRARAGGGTMVSSPNPITVRLCEAAKHGDVDELRELLATASPGEVNAAEPKHGYRPLHYGAPPHTHTAAASCCRLRPAAAASSQSFGAPCMVVRSRLERHARVGGPAH